MESPSDDGENQSSQHPVQTPMTIPLPLPSSPSKPWYSYITSHLQPAATVESADPSPRSTLSVPHLQSLQDLVQETKAKFEHYEGAFFGKVKDEMMIMRYYPATVVGVAVAAGFLLMRGPRNFLLRHTLGHFRSEEAQFIRAEKNVKEMNLSVDLFKKDGNKLLERADLAEKEMRHGHAELMSSGRHIRHMAKSIDQLENRARDLMDVLRKIPGRDAIRLRAEVASLTSLIKEKSSSLDRRMTRLVELGIRV